MKNYSYLLLTPFLLFACNNTENADDMNTENQSEVEVIDSATQAIQEIPEAPKSPRKQASGTVNGVNVDIDYGSPFVRERVIWGELVPYDKIWRAGANDATAITFGQDVIINETTIPAETYALFILPQAEPNKWTVILNEEWSKEIHAVWGAYDHKPEKDVVRFDVTPTFGEENQESLLFEVVDNVVRFKWEKAKFDFSFDPKK